MTDEKLKNFIAQHAIKDAFEIASGDYVLTFKNCNQRLITSEEFLENI